VKIKITAPGENYLFEGVIKDVSSDSLEKEDNNSAAGRFYEVLVGPGEAFLDARINLGIEVEVYVVSDRATMFDYIISVFPSQSKLEVW
jgi:hypothetical protein